jgi:hypothetical protein
LTRLTVSVGSLPPAWKRDLPASLLGLLLQTGSTPLHRAALNGQVEVVRLLLAAGAAVDAANEVRQPHPAC